MTLKETAKKFIPKFLLGVYHFKLALLGAMIFGFPGLDKNIKIIGVTGTSGKSTTVDFITRILEEAGHKVASTSTARFKVAEKIMENKYKMTMPGRFIIQKFLRQAKDAGCNFIVLEVTSEGIRQFRHKFIDFDAVVFTNLSKEHIESHGSFENYRNEKLKLFKACKNIHVINTDDPNAKYFMDMQAKTRITLGIKDAQNLETTETGLSFQLQNTKFQISLLGHFNVYNALAAIAVGGVYGVPLSACAKALEKAKGVPGRMEIVHKNPTVVVDYAHTPEQLEAVYKTFSGKNLICVLGSCGGGRDKWKRPVLGEIAKKYCSEIILTNEDPYDENPNEIMEQIKSGVTRYAPYAARVILDRKEAIEKAIKSVKPGDVVIITGKGSEPWMCVANGKKIPCLTAKLQKTLCRKSEFVLKFGRCNMKIRDIYNLMIKMGTEADFRGIEGVQKFLNRKKKKFEQMPQKSKDEFDQEALTNPYLDSGVYNIFEDKEIKKVLVGIDIGPEEILIAKELGDIDLVIAHHPVGKGLAQLADVMDLQVDVCNYYGVPVNIAESLMRERISEVARGVNASNHQRTVDSARLMKINLMNSHTPCDNLAAKFLKAYIEQKKPETLAELIEVLKEIPEYKEAMKIGVGPKIFVGSPDNRCGKIALSEITGGTEGSPKLYEKMAQAGVGTIVGMHIAEEHRKEAEASHINIVIAGHISSDSLGVNLFLDELQKQGIEIVSCSGFTRFPRI